MVKQNDFSQVKFEKCDMQFKDGRSEYEAKLLGDFTREGLAENLQMISDSIKGNKSALVGVAFHYKNVNDWVPAMYTQAGDSVKIWNPLDSPKGEAYEDDTIDGAVFYIIKANDGYDPNKQIYRKPQHNTEKAITQNVFKKKK